MIVWCLKHGENVRKFGFDTFYSNDYNGWIALEKSKSSVWKAAFGDISSNKVVKIGGDTGVTFIAGERLKPVIISESEGIFEYYLCQNDIEISEIPLQNSSSELILEIFERNPEDEQVGSLIKNIAELDQSADIGIENIDLVVETEGSPGSFLTSTLKSWKSDLKRMFPGKDLMYIEKDDPENGSLFKVDFSALEDDLSFDFPCMNYQNVVVRKPVKNYMKFRASIPAPTITTESAIDIVKKKDATLRLENSFKHDLTPIGKLALSRLENDLLDRIKPWIEDEVTNLVAPVVSLCQSSGTGKSKLAFELLKRHVGFYIVLRLKDQTGYPQKNYLSDKLIRLISTYKDSAEILDNVNYELCITGQVLFLFAQIIIRCLTDLIQALEEKPLADAIRDNARKFEMNDKLDDCLFEEANLSILIRECLNLKNDTAITVDMIASYIKCILEDPTKCFRRSALNGPLRKRCSGLAHKLEKFPFLFVIDEAEILSKTPTENSHNNPVNGFEALRRALSYLKPQSRILFLTLGTKSNVLDLNPEVIDRSKRLKNRTKLPFPIILSSNLNIWSKDFSPHSVKPTYQALLNPMFFKYLCTLGHSIWSSLPFSSVVGTGVEKIVNGTTASGDYVLVLWMILTGMAANPFSVEAGTIVANHMGYLLDISEDLKRLIVMYPPEPILAIIAHTIIDTKITDDALFRVLQRKLEATDIDRGKIAELFGGMIILRAIWKSPSTLLAGSSEFSYDNFQEHMQTTLPDLNYIWERNIHVLQERVPRDVESEIEKISVQIEKEEISRDSGSEAIRNLEIELDRLKGGNLYDFAYYKVHTVSDFLKSLLDISDDQIASKGFPKEVLDGLVNGTHMASLDNFAESLSFGSKIFTPQKPKLADDRIADTSRYILTDDLLRLCITMQLIIKFPPGYYGLDYAIPVMLRDQTVTFIGVQIKRANANLSDDIYKMRSKLHFVRCPDPKCTGKACGHCTSMSSLKLIYSKQISIVLSLDEDEKFQSFSPSQSTKYFKGCHPANQSYLTELLIDGKEQTLAQLKKLKLKSEDLELLLKPRTLKFPNFFKPLISTYTPLKDDILLSKSLWYDKHVKLEKIKLGKTREIRFTRDGFIHRQFCISVRGWDNFAHLFTDFISSKEIVHRLMNSEGLSRHFPGRKNNPDFIRKLVYDLSVTFPLYSEELRRARGEESWFDAITAEVEKNWAAMKKKIATEDEEESEIGGEIEPEPAEIWNPKLSSIAGLGPGSTLILPRTGAEFYTDSESDSDSKEPSRKKFKPQ